MSAEAQVQTIKDGYAGFARGDAAEVIQLFAEDVSYTINGASSLSGTHNGRDEVLAMWGKLRPGFTTTPRIIASDGDNRVVVITDDSQDGESWSGAAVFTFDGDLVASYEGLQDTATMDRLYPVG